MPAKPLVKCLKTGRWELVLKDKPKNGLCLVAGCGKRRPRERYGKKAGNICPACLRRRWNANNPEAACYSKLRANARARGKDFTITLAEFRVWGAKHGYFDLRGRASGSLHVDRIRDEEGYHIGNIQVLTSRQNVTKENKRRARIRQELLSKGRYLPADLRAENDLPIPPEDGNEPF